MTPATGYRLPATGKSGKREAGSGKRLLVTDIGELITNPGPPGDLGIVADAAVAISGERVAWVGPGGDVPAEHRHGEVVSAGGGAVLPGFVDAHTHLVFAGDRSDEFARRLRGEPYADILASGGGIHATVAATRAAMSDSLVDEAAARLERMLRSGTTTVEVKSGYGLTTEHEVRILEVAVAAGVRSPVDVVPTFLAHVPDKGSDPGEYAELVVEEIIPATAPLARYCDVFCDRGAFDVDQSRRILEAGRAHGLQLRVHAEQLTHTGGAALAADLRAVSADHLDHATEEDARLLREAGVVAVVLPAASLSMRSPRAPARMLWDSGVTVALATDCNPGTSNVENMSLVVALACLEMNLSPEEAVWAATRGGALALDTPDLGSIVPGARGDLVILDAPSHRHIPYRPGTNLVRTVVKGGEVVV